MKNLKPSQLPADTVIKDEVWGVWMKEESGVWGETVPHCVDCIQAVRDDGTTEVWMDNKQVLITSDDLFQDFKIISVPFKVAELLVEALWDFADNFGGGTTDKDAIWIRTIEEVRNEES